MKQKQEFISLILKLMIIIGILCYLWTSRYEYKIIPSPIKFPTTLRTFGLTIPISDGESSGGALLIRVNRYTGTISMKTPGGWTKWKYQQTQPNLQ